LKTGQEMAVVVSQYEGTLFHKPLSHCTHDSLSFMFLLVCVCTMLGLVHATPRYGMCCEPEFPTECQLKAEHIAEPVLNC